MANLPSANPFPGLRPFDQRDSRIFFGRDDQVDNLLDRLEVSRFIAVVGSSASGKSSLVRAGLLPALHGGHLTSAGSRWRIVVMRPGARAIANLAEVLEECGALGHDGDAPTRLGLARAVLESGDLGLSEIVAQSQAAEPKNLLLVVDQFEELFRFRQDRDDAAAFVKLLLAATARQSPPIYALVTMRSDFLGDCSEFRDLPETISYGLFLVPRLKRDQLREAIEGPVSVANAVMEPTLVTQLLNDLGDSPDQLPALQHALMRTWDIWAARDEPERPIGLEEFAATGGIANALSLHGDALYDALPPHLQRVAERVFCALADRSDGERGVRRPTSLAQLVGVTGESIDDVRAVVEIFRAPTCSFLGPPPPAPLIDGTIIDVSHESLMRVWTRFTQWSADEAESARIYRRIADAAELHARGEAPLLIDPELESDLTWRDEHTPTAAWAERYEPGFERAMKYLDDSVSARNRELSEATRARRRRAAFATGFSLAVLLLVVAALGTLALLRERGATLAAQSRALARDAQAAIDRGDAVTGMLLALEALPEHLDHPDRPFVIDAQDALQRALASRREIRDLTGHTAAIYRATFSPDGKRVATASSDGTVRVWDAGTGKTLGVLRGHRSRIATVDFSPDGKRIVTGSDDTTIRIWNAITFEALIVIHGPRASVRWADFSPDGAHIVAASQDGATRIFDAATGKLERVFSLGDCCLQANYFPDSHRILTSPNGGPVRIYDARTGKALLDFHGAFGEISVTAIGSDGKRIAVSSRPDVMQVWDSRTGKLLYQMREPGAVFHAAAFSPDGKLLATSWNNTRIRIWNALDGTPLYTLGEHEGRVWSVQFSADSKRLVSADGDKSARIWNVEPEPVRFLHANTFPLTSLNASADGTRVVTTGNDHMIRIWNVADGKVRVVFGDDVKDPDGVNYAAFSHDGRMIAGAFSDGTIHIWDAGTGRTLRVFRGHRDAASKAVFSPDDRTVLSGSYDGTIRTWNAMTGTNETVIHTKPVQAVAYSNDGRLIASASRSADIWDSRTGKRIVHEPTTDGGVVGVGFSPDGTSLIAAYDEFVGRIWSARDGRLLHVLHGHESDLSAAAFSPDGRLAMTASNDSTARIWDPQSGAPLFVIRDRGAQINDSAFSSDGRMLITGDDLGDLGIWKLPPFPRCQALIDRARATLPRSLSSEQRDAESIADRGSPITGYFMGGETCK